MANQQGPGAKERRTGLRIASAGQCWLLTTLLLVGLGLFKNINLLALLGYAMAAVLALNLFVAGRRLRRARARPLFAQPVFAGAPAQLEVRVDGPPRGACMSVRIEMPLGDNAPARSLAWFVERLARSPELILREKVVWPQRGRHAWGPVRAISGHPFGLVSRSAQLAPAGEILVLPRLGNVERSRLRRYLRSTEMREQRAHVRRAGLRHAVAQDEVHGLRAYRSGDSPRAIHWRTSARRGELMVREFEALPGDDLLVIFDPSVALDPGVGERFESAVSLAAALCWEWCRRRGDRLALAIAGPEGPLLDGFTGPDHAQRVLEALALVQPTPASPASEVVARLGSDLRRSQPAVVVVSAGPSALAVALRQRLGRPLAALSADAMNELDFYEPPAPQPEEGRAPLPVA